MSSWFKESTTEERRLLTNSFKLKWSEPMVGDMVFFNAVCRLTKKPNEVVWCVTRNKKNILTAFDLTNQKNLTRKYGTLEWFLCAGIMRNGELCDTVDKLKAAL